MSKFSSTDSGATILSKLNNTIVTVGLSTGADYVCDGVADDVQINAAITAVNAAGGGTIIIRSGTYDITTKIIFKDYVHIIGEGFSTILKMTAGFAADAQGYYFLMGTAATESTVGYNYDISLENICLDGNKANQTSAAGKHNLIHSFGDYHFVLRNVEFKNGTGTGLDLDNTGGWVEACVSHDNGLDGFYLNHLTPEGHRMFTIIGCQSYLNGRDGIFSPEYGGNILYNMVWSNTSNGIHTLGFSAESLGSAWKRIIGNHIRANGLYGIYLESDGATYIATKTIVSQNNLDTSNGSIYGNQYTTNNIISENILDKPVNFVTSGNLIRNNIGHVTENSGTGTIASGATTAVITHGLSVTPTLKDISITFGEQGSNDYGRWWVSNLTSTQFTLNVSADPGASNLDFAWKAICL